MLLEIKDLTIEFHDHSLPETVVEEVALFGAGVQRTLLVINFQEESKAFITVPPLVMVGGA